MTGSWQARAGIGGILLAAVLTAAGCGSSPGVDAAPRGDSRSATGTERVALRPPAPVPAPAPSRTPVRRGCQGGRLHAVTSPTGGFAGVARRPTVARRTPNGPVRARFGQINDNGHATVFGIRGVLRDGCGRLWYRVLLPMRPNGATGFVPARDVRVVRVDTRIVVDLSDRRVTLYRSGKPVLRSRVAVGSPTTPTPTGRFYVSQRLLAADPAGPWGPGAIGISAFSEVLSDWPQGGPIAIHGTNDPESIGRAASHGCVRVPNDTLERLLQATPAGTPVAIRE